jgi:hypothetical protein
MSHWNSRQITSSWLAHAREASEDSVEQRREVVPWQDGGFFAILRSFKNPHQFVQVLVDGGDEPGARQFPGCGQAFGEAGAGQGGHGGIEGLAELDGLDLLRRIVQAGFAEGVDEGGDGGEDGHPIDPAREAGGL